jgi:hypothetical protein
MPGARCTRGLACNMMHIGAHEHTGSAETLRHSPRNGFTAYAVLSPATSFFVTVADGLKDCLNPVGSTPLRQLGISSGCQDHTVLPYAARLRLPPSSERTSARQERLRRAQRRSSARRWVTHGNPPCDHDRARRCRVHRSPPHVRDDGQRPSGRDGMRGLFR